jgi:hypothetical protein
MIAEKQPKGAPVTNGASASGERIAALAAKAAAVQSGGPPDIDWSRPPSLPVWLPRRLAARAVTQYHRGEIATARACETLRYRLALPAARDFLRIQATDERRHATLYDAYLGKIGGPRPRSLSIEETYEKALAWQGAPEAIILAFHAILEGESLRLQQVIDKWLPCPLFREISAVINRDEARHIAFGRIYLREALPYLPRGERLAIFAWARDLWFDAVRDAIADFAPPGLFRAGGGWKRWLATEWEERLGDLRDLNLFAGEEREIFIRS